VRGGMRSNASVTFGVTPDSLMDAWMRQLNRHGCRSFWIYDVLFNTHKTLRLAKVAKEAGAEVAGAIGRRGAYHKAARQVMCCRLRRSDGDGSRSLGRERRSGVRR